MTPIKFTESNSVIKGSGDVGDLPVYYDGASYASVWELSDDDMMNIVKNRMIVLVVTTGQRMSFLPVQLRTIDPLEYEDKPTHNPDTPESIPQVRNRVEPPAV